MRSTDDYEMSENNGLPLLVKVIGGVFAAALLAFAVFVMMSFEPPDPKIAKTAELELELEPEGRDDHPGLRFAWDVSATESPEMVPCVLDDSNASKKVLGVVVDSVAHAYVIKHVGLREFWLVSTVVGGKPIILIHNYLLDKTRVLTKNDSKELVNIRMGGMTGGKVIAVLYDGNRYHQFSESIGLDDYPFEMTTLGQWYEKHPETLVNYDQEEEDPHFMPFD